MAVTEKETQEFASQLRKPTYVISSRRKQTESSMADKYYLATFGINQIIYLQYGIASDYLVK